MKNRKSARPGKAVLLLLFLALAAKTWGQDVYQMVSSTDELEADAYYLIVNTDAGKAMSTDQKSNNRGETNVVVDNGTITAPGATACSFLLKKGSKGWTFYDEANQGYLYAAGGDDDNYLRTSKSLNNNCYATITMEDGNAAIVFDQGDATRNILRYNSSYSMFTCYEDIRNMDAVQLFKKVSSGQPQVAQPVLSPAHGTTFTGHLTVTVSCATEGATVYYTSDGTTPTASSSIFPASGLDISQTTTIKAMAACEEMRDSEVATATYTLEEAPSSLGAKALVATKDGVYYAMETTAKNDGLNAFQVEIWEDKVVHTAQADILWYIDEDNGLFQTPSGNYLTGTASSTALGTADEACAWTWNDTYSTWIIPAKSGSAERSFIYNGGIFKNYDVSNVKAGTGGYADTYTKAMPVADGYVRNINPGFYGTLCLPYAVEAGNLSGADFFSIAGKVMQDGMPQSLVLEPVTALEAGVPYVFFNGSSDKLIAVYSGEPVSAPREANGLVGSFGGQDVAEGMYLFTVNNEVQLCGKGCSIAGNRAYIDMAKVPELNPGEMGVNRRVISLDNTTGILPTPAKGTRVDVYTLSGVEIRHQVDASEATSGLPQGIYLVNGRKMIVK